MKEHKLTLRDRQVTLIRVALLQRMDRLKQKGFTEPGTKASYDDMRAMMDTGGVLSLRALNEADITRKSLEAARQIGLANEEQDR